MGFVAMILVAAATFGVCFLADKGFQKLFRSKAQHHSGKAVRANKRYGLFGIILGVLGIAGIFAGTTMLLIAGIVVLLTGAALCVYYLSFGIYYDGESLLYSAFGKKSVEYRYNQIRHQQLYVITGGNVVVELHMTDGNAVSIQTQMENAVDLLDTAFAGWCRQRGIDPESCDFHDRENSLWFPTEEVR